MTQTSKSQFLTYAFAIVLAVAAWSNFDQSAEAQSVSTETCENNNLEISITVDTIILNHHEGKHVNLQVRVANIGAEKCRTLVALTVPRESGLILLLKNSTTGDWLDESDQPDQERKLLVSRSIVLEPGKTKRLGSNVKSIDPPLSKVHLISATVCEDQDKCQNTGLQPTDWRNIWIWADKEPNPDSSAASSRRCQRATPVISRTAPFNSNMTITPLILSFNCEFRYSVLDAIIETKDELPQISLRPRIITRYDKTIESFRPFHISADHKQSGRYTVVFMGVPREIPGLRLEADSQAKPGVELVPFSPRFTDRIRIEIADAYDLTLENKTLVPLAYVSGITIVILLWLMLVPIGPGGWAGQRYQWSPPGLIWTLTSVSLVIGTITLIGLAVVTTLGAIIAGHRGSSITAGTGLAVVAAWIGLLFAIATIRQRLRSKATQRTAGTMLPWWLQDPLSCDVEGTSSPRRTVQRRRDGTRSIFSRIFGKDNRRKRKRSSAALVGWRWVYLLALAGTISIVSVAILTP